MKLFLCQTLQEKTCMSFINWSTTMKLLILRLKKKKKKHNMLMSSSIYKHVSIVCESEISRWAAICNLFTLPTSSPLQMTCYGILDRSIANVIKMTKRHVLLFMLWQVFLKKSLTNLFKIHKWYVYILLKTSKYIYMLFQISLSLSIVERITTYNAYN